MGAVVQIGPVVFESSLYVWRNLIPPFPAYGIRRYVENKHTGERFLIHDTETWFPIVADICLLRFIA